MSRRYSNEPVYGDTTVAASPYPAPAVPGAGALRPPGQRRSTSPTLAAPSPQPPASAPANYSDQGLASHSWRDNPNGPGVFQPQIGRTAVGESAALKKLPASADPNVNAARAGMIARRDATVEDQGSMRSSLGAPSRTAPGVMTAPASATAAGSTAQTADYEPPAYGSKERTEMRIEYDSAEKKLREMPKNSPARAQVQAAFDSLHAKLYGTGTTAAAQPGSATSAAPSQPAPIAEHFPNEPGYISHDPVTGAGTVNRNDPEYQKNIRTMYRSAQEGATRQNKELEATPLPQPGDADSYAEAGSTIRQGKQLIGDRNVRASVSHSVSPDAAAAGNVDRNYDPTYENAQTQNAVEGARQTQGQIIQRVKNAAPSAVAGRAATIDANTQQVLPTIDARQAQFSRGDYNLNQSPTLAAPSVQPPSAQPAVAQPTTTQPAASPAAAAQPASIFGFPTQPVAHPVDMPGLQTPASAQPAQVAVDKPGPGQAKMQLADGRVVIIDKATRKVIRTANQ